MPNFEFRRGRLPGRRRPSRLLGAVALCLALAGCGVGAAVAPGAPADAATDDGRLVVLTTFTVLADMAREVGGEHVRVESVTKVGAEIHGYEPTPDDLRRASRADLILDNGMGLEAWFEPFVARLDAPHVTVSDGVETIAIRSGRYDGKPNPHAWMSPSAGEVYVRNIAAALAAADPAHAVDYRANADRYAGQVRAVGERLEADLATLPAAARMLVTCEGAFSYLARDVGLDEAFLWPVNADQQGTPQQLARVIDVVRERSVPAVFCETTVSDRSQRQVAGETGARYGGTLYVDSLSRPDGDVPTYLDLLAYDAHVIADGLRSTS